LHHTAISKEYSAMMMFRDILEQDELADSWSTSQLHAQCQNITTQQLQGFTVLVVQLQHSPWPCPAGAADGA
jgi:hypothetical protein